MFPKAFATPSMVPIFIDLVKKLDPAGSYLKFRWRVVRSIYVCSAKASASID
jgi:hypothetical protein